MKMDIDMDNAKPKQVPGGTTNWRQTQQEPEPQQQPMNLHVPWQMEWKRPQWIVSSASSPKSRTDAPLSNNESRSSNESMINDDSKIVGATTAQLSPEEISEIIGFDQNTHIHTRNNNNISGGNENNTSSILRKDRHYLLSVTLLGWWSPPSSSTGDNATKNARTRSDHHHHPVTSLASEVLIEVLEVPTSTTTAASGSDDSSSSNNNDKKEQENRFRSETTASVLRSKRLRWPESIFDDGTAAAAIAATTSAAAFTAKNSNSSPKKPAKRKSFLASIFLPLMGIDEKDEYQHQQHRTQPVEEEQGHQKGSAIKDSPILSIEQQHQLKQQNQQQQQHAPTMGIVSATLCRRPANDGLATSTMKDMVDLMSFSAGNSGGVITTAEPTTDQLPVVGEEGSRDENIQTYPTSTSPTAHVEGELSFACVSKTGEVFVYDPIKLLLGIEDELGLDKGEKDAKKGLEEASSFFFGEELFRNLQETWKPLAEPSARIHLSLFQHDQQQTKHKQQQNKNTMGGGAHDDSLENLVRTNQEISEWSQSVLSRAGCPTSGRPESRRRSPKSRRHHTTFSSGSSDSVGSNSSNDNTDAASIVTSATDALGTIRTLASEWQSGIDETLSMLPYLFNPLLEPATLKNRTVRNQPLKITVAGASCVVVIGSGLRTKRTKQGGATKRSSSSKNNNIAWDRNASVTPKGRGFDDKDDDYASAVAVGSSASHGTDTTSLQITNPNQKSSLRDDEKASETKEEGAIGQGAKVSSLKTERKCDSNENDKDIPENPFADSTDEEKEEDLDKVDSIMDGVVSPFSKQTEGIPVAHEEFQPGKSSPATNTFFKVNTNSDEGEVSEKLQSTNPFSDDGDGDASPSDETPNNLFDNDENTDEDANIQGNETSPDQAPSWLDGAGDIDRVGAAMWNESKTNEAQPDNNPCWEDSSDKDSGADNNGGDKASSLSQWKVNEHDAQETEEESKSNEHEARENEEKSQRHYFDGYDKDYEEDKSRGRGGFVTFLSTMRWSETRTLFVPFVPIGVSHISKWNEMELLWVIGDFESLLIRMDSTGPVPVSIRDILTGGRSNEEADLFQTATGSNLTTLQDNFENENENELSPLAVKKFQILPIDQAVTSSITPRLLCASSTGIDPPSILELVDPVNHPNRPNSSRHLTEAFGQPLNNQPALVLLKTLGYCTPQGTVVLRHAPSHVAKITIHKGKMPSTEDGPCDEEPLFYEDSIWAEQGQGWSLLGTKRHIYFICWEGSTLLQGAYVKEFNNSIDRTAPRNVFATHLLLLSSTREVPVEKTLSPYHSSDTVADMGVNILGRASEQDQVFDNPQLFSSAIVQLPLIDEFHPSLLSKTEEGEQFDGSFASVKGSIGNIMNSSRSSISSRRHYSEYLLQQCSSWTQLEDTLDDRIMLERQEPVLCLRSGTARSPHKMFSLRKLVVDNGIHSPFQQVLAWLAKRKNFFVATGIALDLLQDGDSLYHLWKHAEMIDEEDEETKLVGLLDGIAPVRLLDDDNLGTNKCKHSVTATHLSEMTVGCFIKGGVSMANTLVRFLKRNKLYDPARVSLMLSLTTINLFSEDSTIKRLRILNYNEIEFDDLLWPIECLLAIGTEREYLNEVLVLLNNTIPDELRNRQHEEEERKEQNVSTPMMALTKKLIKLILESDPVAIDVLMSFVDDQSQINFWQSLDHKTRLALSLMEIDSSFPFLRQPEVRSWVREELDLCFKKESILPTTWLQELSIACLRNADCDLDDLKMVSGSDDRLLISSSKSDISERTYVISNLPSSLTASDIGKPTSCGDCVEIMNSENEKIRNALLVSNDERDTLDFDLLIPTLLLLENRGFHWLPSSSSSSLQSPSSQLESFTCTTVMKEELLVSTQALVNAACYLAERAPVSGDGGRAARTSILTSAHMRDHTDDAPFLFASFDSKSAMKQCFQANNVVAGAYLIGGKNGFILQICDVLNKGIGMSIADAESYLVSDRLNLRTVEESKTEQHSSFKLTGGHHILLMLLDEHVLRIQTFGDFDFVHNRGKVDPVFAARSILRAWLSLSFGDETVAASSWLGEWLGDRLGIGSCKISPPSSSSFTIATATPLSKPGATYLPHRDDNGANQDRGKRFAASKFPSSSHRLACASLVRSLLWPNNMPTAHKKENDGTANDQDVFPSSMEAAADAMPLADAMRFDKTLLLELLQSCLGLVESVPPDVVQTLQL